MPKLTKITPQQVPGRYNLFIDDVFYCGITEDTLIACGLVKDMILTEDILSQLMDQEKCYKCLNYCYWLLSRKSYFEKDLRLKLRKKEYDDQIIDFAIRKLKDLHYIDDEALSKSFILDKKHFAKKGSKYIEQTLKQKGVKCEDIRELYSEEEEFEKCLLIAQHKYELLQQKESDKFKLKSKLYAFLAQKGFDIDIIKHVIDEIFI